MSSAGNEEFNEIIARDPKWAANCRLEDFMARQEEAYASVQANLEDMGLMQLPLGTPKSLGSPEPIKTLKEQAQRPLGSLRRVGGKLVEVLLNAVENGGPHFD